MTMKPIVVMTTALAAGLLLGCPQPFEVRLVSDPPGTARYISATKRPMPASNAFGFAEIVIGEDCRGADYSEHSFAWRGNSHVWMIRNYCDEEVEVELGGFELVRDVGSRARAARSVEERELSPFEKDVFHLAVAGRSSRPLEAEVLQDAAIGVYLYEIKLNGVETQDPYMDVDDP